MMVKRYVVENIPEAVVMIRRELGKDAVILSTRRVTEKQWLGLWRKKRVEVLAAAGEDMPIQTKLSKSPAHVGETRRVDDKQEQRSLKQPSESTEAVYQQVGVAAQSVAASSELTAVSESQVPVEATETESLRELRDEVADMKVTLRTLLQQTTPVWSNANTAFNLPLMNEKLRNQGLESDKLLALVSKMLNTWEHVSPDTGEHLPDMLIDEVNQLVPSCGRDEPIRQSSRVIAFIGQTGVGKTTTIAKIAALQMLTGQRRVGLITADTYRIAAVEQLRTYAKILDVPLEIVHQAGELEQAVSRLQNRDLILIDTAGRNYGVEENLQEMSDFLNSSIIDEIHLVLSLTSKTEDLHRIVRKFTDFPVDKFLFTKLDETKSYAAALELLYQYKKPVSYFTNGQNVPDDIEIATLERLLSLILKGVA